MALKFGLGVSKELLLYHNVEKCGLLLKWTKGWIFFINEWEWGSQKSAWCLYMNVEIIDESIKCLNSL